jgi:hypothetical protein
MLDQSNNRFLGRVFRNFRLQEVLIVPFVLQITIAVGLVGYLSFRNGQKAVNEVAFQRSHRAKPQKLH